MEPKGLWLAALIVGLLVLALAIDQKTSDTLNHPKGGQGDRDKAPGKRIDNHRNELST